MLDKKRASEVLQHRASPDHNDLSERRIMAENPVNPRVGRFKPPSQIRIEGDVAFVTLSRGFEAIIDAADVESISQYRWNAIINHRHGNKYAVRTDRVTKRMVMMHRQLLNPPRELHVDHADGNGLNNRRYNIRACTYAENQANKDAERRNKLGLKGVTQDGNRFTARVYPNGKEIHLGTFATKEEASAAYIGAAKVLWGKFARK